MEKPTNPAVDDNKQNKNKRRPPSAEEVLAFYESQGLDHRAASLKAIEDLQSALLRCGAAASRRSRLAPSGELQRKLENANTRLAVLDMKLDSKPGYPESLAIGLASGGLLHGFTAALRALADAWRGRLFYSDTSQSLPFKKESGATTSSNTEQHRVRGDVAHFNWALDGVR